jgi:hypothetical protein
MKMSSSVAGTKVSLLIGHTSGNFSDAKVSGNSAMCRMI